MTDDHAQLVSELRALVDTVFDRVEPILRNAADPVEVHRDGADHSDADPDAVPEHTEATSGCSWCPVCAVAALVRGEQHDLVTLVASRLSALIALLRELLDEYWPRPRSESDHGFDGGSTHGATEADSRESAPGYVPISVTIKP